MVLQLLLLTLYLQVEVYELKIILFISTFNLEAISIKYINNDEANIIEFIYYNTTVNLTELFFFVGLNTCQMKFVSVCMWMGVYTIV